MIAPSRVVVTHALFPTLEVEAAILEPLGAEIVWRACCDEDDVIEAGREAVALLVSQAPITRRVIERLSECLAIVKCGVGVDNIDLPAATEHGICVANVPDYGTDEVATHTMALLLGCLRRVTDVATAVRQGAWSSAPSSVVPRSHGRTLGIIGFGRIGRSVARKAVGFGWRLLVHAPRLDPVVVREHGAESVPLDHLLAEADFVTLHVPLTTETYHLIDASALSRMRPTAYLINTSRGGVVDTQALYRALESGRIAGAALDVLEEEPPPTDHPLIACKHALITSHVAWYSEQAVMDLRVKAAREVARVLRGELPHNLLNPAVRPRLTGAVG
jgi:D-3-phosphoglycerate dehydrogenase